MFRTSILAIAISAFGAFNVAAQEAAPSDVVSSETVTAAVTETAKTVVTDQVTDAVTQAADTAAVNAVAAPVTEAPIVSSVPAFSLQDALASGERARSADPVQEKCITIMNGFPNNGHESRYQFFKLTRALAENVDPMLRSAIDFYGDSNVTYQTPVVEVIENIANPVYRQAAPEITVGNMGYLIDFALDCESYLTGQIDSLEAFDYNLTQSDFDVVIGEDALFMKQILSDSLFRLGAQDHDIYGPHVQAYADNLVRARNNVEFASFEAQMANLESVYMNDLDGRLARSNDVINNEMDREALAHALEITNDLNEQAKLQTRQKALTTLSRILNGGW